MDHCRKIRNKLTAGDVLLGTHIFCGSPMLTEEIASIGFDLLWIDMEHTPIDKPQVQENLIAARAGGSHSMVRIPWNDPVLAKPILDMGPEAILFPYIRSVEEAKKAVSACRYPPHGERGYGPLRALDYGAQTQLHYVRKGYRSTLIMLQIEHIDAVNCLDEIASLDEIDALIVGMNDLSGSVGHMGEPLHPDMFPIYERICSVLRGRKPFGISMEFDDRVTKWWRDSGAQLFFCGSDVAFVYQGASNTRARQMKLKRRENKNA